MKDIEKKIIKYLNKEANTNLNIDHLDMVHIMKLEKNDYNAPEEYPIVDKGVILAEVEYYINGEGTNRCFAIEEETGRFLDTKKESDVLNLIMKMNKRISTLQDEIRRLDFEKADDQNIKCTKILIENKDGMQTTTEMKKIDQIDEQQPRDR